MYLILDSAWLRSLLPKNAILVAKGVVERISNAAGFAISRNSRRRSTQSTVVGHVYKLGFRPRTVIDVGVGHGTPELYGRFPGATHLLVEPLKEYEHVIKEISRKHETTYVIAAAGASPGTVTINVHPALEGSSTYKESEGSHADGYPRTIPVVTLDQLCAERNLVGPYLVKVDVQGAELDVLSGASRVLTDAELVLLEVSLFQFYTGSPQFYDVVHFMKERGFVAYDIVDGHNRPIDGALAQVDMAFVKENGMFRKHHLYAARDQREKIDERQAASSNPGGT